MILNLKELFETNVNKISNFLVLLILIIFPINQQFHVRPFSSVEGFIIDYLIIKISAQELVLSGIFLLNIFLIVKFFKDLRKVLVLILFLLLGLLSVLNSKYIFLAVFDNIAWFLIVMCSIIFLIKPSVLKEETIVFSIKFWLITLSIIGFLQFLNQGSIFNNYHVTGEYPYSAENLFIKQKNTILTEYVPSMGIFSHSNIFGAYFLFLLFLLRGFKKDRVIFHILGVIVFFMAGSLPVVIAYLIWILTIVFPRILNLKLFGLIIFLNIFTFVFSPNLIDLSFTESNYSIFRRVYLLEISREYFINNPLKFFFGFGYMNYFSIVRNNLWDYEIIRFFQPPHNIFVFIIWNYGFIFLILVFYILYKVYILGSFEAKVFVILVLILGTFDHYIITNHQFQILGVLIPYSLFSKNKV